MNYINKIFFKSSKRMDELPDSSIHLIVTSPPYFNIKDYSKNGYQNQQHSDKKTDDIGSIDDYEKYLNELLIVWKECERVLKPNGKLIINTPLMPMKKSDLDTHYNRHIFDINSDLEYLIIRKTNMYLMDLYIWNRTNSTKKLMFGSYPYPRNFYAQNTTEFIAVYVKDGKPEMPTDEQREKSMLTEKEWTEYTKQIWDIPVPNKSDIAFGKHSAIMPEEIPYRCIKMFSFYGDVVLDPFAGSGTTLKIAKQLGRNFVGYEIYKSYKPIIYAKISQEILMI